MNFSKIVLIVVFTLMFSSAFCQDDKFTIGVEGGPSLIFFHGKNHTDQYYKPRAGYAFGLSFRSQIAKNSSLGLDVLYERKGSVMQIKHTYINGTSAPDTTIHINADYITLPFTGHASFGNKIHYFINAGPYLGFLLKGTSQVQSFNGNTNTEQDYTNRLQNFDIGITAGLGMQIPIKTDFALSLEARHNLGLHNLIRNHPDASESMKTSSTNFLVGLVYTLIK